jgi:hypothetical protein
VPEVPLVPPPPPPVPLIRYPPGLVPSCNLMTPAPLDTVDSISAVSSPGNPTYAAFDPDAPRNN